MQSRARPAGPAGYRVAGSTSNRRPRRAPRSSADSPERRPRHDRPAKGRNHVGVRSVRLPRNEFFRSMTNMRIDQLRIQNFKRFEEQRLDLHPRFTLLVGDNGAGKTTILDALAVAAGIWLVKPPDSMLANSGRNILRNEIRLGVRHEGDRSRFVECKPVSVTATGEICRSRSRVAPADSPARIENDQRRGGRSPANHRESLCAGPGGRQPVQSRHCLLRCRARVASVAIAGPDDVEGAPLRPPLGGILRLLSGTNPGGRPENLVSTRSDRLRQSGRALEARLPGRDWRHRSLHSRGRRSPVRR